MKKIKHPIQLLLILGLGLFSQIAFAQNNPCLTRHIDDLDKLLSPESIKVLAQGAELDHYLQGAGTKYAESQFFWYPTEETTHFVKLYSLRKEKDENPIERFQKRVQDKSDEIYTYDYAGGIGDYAFWTRGIIDADSEPSTVASLKVLLNKEAFVVHVDLGDYTQSQEIAVNLAKQIIETCN